MAASNSAKKFPRTKTASRGRSGTSCATSTAPLKPPSAATRPTGSGSTAAGKRRDGEKRRWRMEDRKWKPAILHPLPSAEQAKAVAAILVRGTNWLGDAVMTTPALLRLRERFPDAHIALLTPEKLAICGPIIRQSTKRFHLRRTKMCFRVGKKLRAGKFDLALVLPNSPRSALEVWLAGIPQRIGYARPWRNFFLTHAVAAACRCRENAETVRWRNQKAGRCQ